MITGILLMTLCKTLECRSALCDGACVLCRDGEVAVWELVIRVCTGIGVERGAWWRAKLEFVR